VHPILQLGWFDDISHRSIHTDITQFLTASTSHCVIGLRILHSLVDELNIPTSGRTLTQHRKTAVSFRDVSLFPIFQLGLTTLKQLHTGAISGDAKVSPSAICERRAAERALSERCSVWRSSLTLALQPPPLPPLLTLASLAWQILNTLTHLSLQLTAVCLSFDFIGTNPDESSEDVGTIQVPSTWRGTISDPGTTQLFMHFYATTQPPVSDKSLECVILLTSIRRSLFSTDSDRSAFLTTLMTGITGLMSTQTGLEHADNYHQVRQRCEATRQSPTSDCNRAVH